MTQHEGCQQRIFTENIHSENKEETRIQHERSHSNKIAKGQSKFWATIRFLVDREKIPILHELIGNLLWVAGNPTK